MHTEKDSAMWHLHLNGAHLNVRMEDWYGPQAKMESGVDSCSNTPSDQAQHGSNIRIRVEIDSGSDMCCCT